MARKNTTLRKPKQNEEPTNAPGTSAAANELSKVAAIVRQRSGTHGDAVANLTDIARRWSAHLQTKYGIKQKLDVVDVASFMIEMKLSRANYGDSNELDHSRDIMGYAAIQAGYLSTKDTN